MLIGAIVAALFALPVTTRFGLISSREVFQELGGGLEKWPFGFFDWLANALVLLLLIVLVFWIFDRIQQRLRRKRRNLEKEIPQYRLLDDAPVLSGDADLLGRAGFVKTLSRTVVLPPNANSIVLALEGAWGSGKSSVLHLLDEELKIHPDKPLLIRFNPWVATGRDRIFRAFFSQFSAALLGEGERRAAASLVAFAEAIEDLVPSGARILPRLGFQRVRRLLGGIPVVDLEEQKSAIVSQVQSAGRPIVVVIDDIDRLPPEDIRTIFQLVKAIAAFPRVAYLLAFDPEPVDLALGHDGNANHGRQFRDKIIQASLPLPKSAYRLRKRYIQTLLHERLSSWKIDLRDFEDSALGTAVPLVLTALTTPRDVKRVINATLVKAENLQGEVNLADILVFETLHAKYPEIAEVIRRHPEEVNPAGVGEGDDPDSILPTIRRMSDKRSKSERLDDFVSGLSGDRETPKALLSFLFPTVFSDTSADYTALAAFLRVAYHENLLKLLFLGPQGEILSASEAKDFLEQTSERGAYLAEQVEAGSLPLWISHLRNYVAHSEVADPATLIQQVIAAVTTLFQRSGVDITSEARWLLLELLQKIPGDARFEYLHDLFANPECVSVGEEMLVTLLQDADLWQQGVYRKETDGTKLSHRKYGLTNEELVKLVQTWLSSVQSLGVPFFLEGSPNAIGVFHRWGQLEDPPYADIATRLDDAFDVPHLAVAFAMRFPPGIALDGIEKLVLSTAQTKLSKAIRDDRSIPESISKRFEAFFHRLPTEN